MKSLKILFLVVSLLCCSRASAQVQVDDVILYFPTAANFTLNACGVKSKHDFSDKLFLTAVSWGVTAVVTEGLKITISEERPDGSDDKSFPSGHTARAFCGAHSLYMEYKEVSPWIGVAGYAVATTTGVLRVTGKHHHVHDVLAGAAIGVLSSQAAYWLLPTWKKHFTWKKKDKELAVLPAIGSHSFGISGGFSF